MAADASAAAGSGDGKAPAAPAKPDLYAAEKVWLDGNRWMGYGAGFAAMTVVDVLWRRRMQKRLKFAADGLPIPETTAQKVMGQAVPFAAGFAALRAVSEATNVYAVAYRLNDFPRSRAAESLCPAVLESYGKQSGAAAAASEAAGAGTGTSGDEWDGSGSGSARGSGTASSLRAAQSVAPRGGAGAQGGAFSQRMVAQCLRYRARVQTDSIARAAALPGLIGAGGSSGAPTASPSPAPTLPADDVDSGYGGGSSGRTASAPSYGSRSSGGSGGSGSSSGGNGFGSRPSAPARGVELMDDDTSGFGSDLDSDKGKAAQRFRFGSRAGTKSAAQSEEEADWK